MSKTLSSVSSRSASPHPLLSLKYLTLASDTSSLFTVSNRVFSAFALSCSSPSALLCSKRISSLNPSSASAWRSSLAPSSSSLDSRFASLARRLSALLAILLTWPSRSAHLSPCCTLSLSSSCSFWDLRMSQYPRRCFIWKFADFRSSWSFLQCW